jgi:hypothetical protein
VGQERGVIRPYPMLAGALAHDPAHSIATTGYLRLRFRARRRRALFEGEAGKRYENVIRKGTTAGGDCELAVRFHSDDHPEKPGQICGYAFNPLGGLGAGVRFGTTLPVGFWIDVDLCFDTFVAPDRPHGRISMVVDRQLAASGEREFRVRGVPVVPVAGPAPVEIRVPELVEIDGLIFDDGVPA